MGRVADFVFNFGGNNREYEYTSRRTVVDWLAKYRYRPAWI